MARPPSDDDLAALAAASPLVVLLDVDGTLAPIAPRPEDARVPAETRAALRRLAARRDTRVAILTGRVASDARAMVDVGGTLVVGNHGAERIEPDGSVCVDEAVAPFEAALARAAAELTARLAAIPGVLIEFKRWSLAVHYRLADHALLPEITSVVSEAASREGLRRGEGKEVFELRPPADVNKGTAALALLRRFGAPATGRGVLFAGDDVTDEDAFRRLAAEAPQAFTVRVGALDAETAARFVVDDPAAVRALLERLASLG